MTLRLSAMFCLVIAACGPKPATDVTPDPVTHPDVVSNTAEKTHVSNPATAPLAIVPMRGPFATAGAFCATTEDNSCEPFGVENPKPIGAPFTEAVYLAVGVEGYRDCYVGVEVGGQWYFADQAQSCMYQDTRTMSEVIDAALYSEQLFPPGVQLILELTERDVMANMDNDGRLIEENTRVLVLCGVGASGAPSCTEPLIVSRSWTDSPIDDGGGQSQSGSWEVQLDYHGDVLTVIGDSEDAAGRIGDHTIVFP